MILTAFKYRLYPNKSQLNLIDKHINSCRFVYNLALETKQSAYSGAKINLTKFDLTKQLPELKTACPWLNDINSQSLQVSIFNLDNAFNNFFKNTGKYPIFKSKRSFVQSFTIPQNVKIENNKLSIPKFKEGIKINLHRVFEGKIKRATISKTPTGKYFASILVETPNNPIPKQKITEENTIGIDLGIKDFAITSDGEKFNNPKYLKKTLTKLKFVQRQFSKKKGKRVKQKLALLHEKVKNKRNDFLHKLSTKLIRENQTIALETLKVKNMVKNHNLAQSISDASWGTFVSMLEYKAEWYGVNIIKIGQFEPSSKLCTCGVKNKELKLSDRFWKCASCGIEHDRDILAANNIKSFALRNHLSGTDRKNQNELPTLVGVMTSETVIKQ